MPGQLNALEQAFREAMAAAWPEVVPNGIWDGDEAIRRSFERNMALPYAVIDLASFPVSDRDGITNRAWRPRFSLYYIAETEGDSDALTLKLETLAEYLDTHALGTGQIIPPNVSISTGPELQPNALLILLNATQRAGMVSGTVAVGVTRG
jgi:hypothetical protein